jgi:hypothetical protein
MRISAYGYVIVTGLFKISNLTSKQISGSMVGDSIAWFELLEGKSIRDLDLGELTFTGDQSILDYYSGRTDIAWPLVHWGGFENRLSIDTYVYGSRKTTPINTYKNLKPAVYVKHIFTKILNSVGIAVAGEFLDSEEFEKLIVLFGGDDSAYPWKNLTRATLRQNTGGLRLHINDQVSGQFFGASKYTDVWQNAPRVRGIERVVSNISGQVGDYVGFILVQGNISNFNDVNNCVLYRWNGTGWDNISTSVNNGTILYINDLTGFNQNLSVGTSKYFRNGSSGNFINSLAQINITSFPAEPQPSLTTVIRGSVTTLAYKQILVDDGDNASPVKQGLYNISGTTLTKVDPYQAVDFKNEFMIDESSNRFIVTNLPSNPYQGPWNIYSFNNVDGTNERIYRMRDKYEVPVDGRYDVKLGYGQFSAAFNTSLQINIDTINSYFAGSNFYGNTWMLLNAHMIMAIKNYSTDPNFAIDKAREMILASGGVYSKDYTSDDLGEFNTGDAQAVLAATLRTGHVFTLYDAPWSNDWELVRGDDVTIVHVTFCGGSLIIGGWEDSFVGCNSGNDSYDVFSIRLTEELDTVTETVNGETITTQIKPQIWNAVNDKYEEGRTTLSVAKLLPDMSQQDFIRGIVDLYNLYWVYDSSTNSLGCVPFVDFYKDSRFALNIDNIVQEGSETINPINAIPGVILKYSDDEADEYQHPIGSVGAWASIDGNKNTIYREEQIAEITLPWANSAGVGCVLVPGLETYGVTGMYTQEFSAVVQRDFNNHYDYHPRIVSLLPPQALTTSQVIGTNHLYVYIQGNRYAISGCEFNTPLWASEKIKNYEKAYALFDAKEEWTVMAYIDDVLWKQLRLDMPIQYRGQLFYPKTIGPYTPGRASLTKITMVKL